MFIVIMTWSRQAMHYGKSSFDNATQHIHQKQNGWVEQNILFEIIQVEIAQIIWGVILW